MGGGRTGTITRLRERRGPGGSPGLQNQWRGARRRAVGSTPMRSRQGGSMEKHGGSRPPSVERVLAVVRERLDGSIDAVVLREAAREIVGVERTRLRNGEPPQSVEALGDEVESLLASRQRSLVETLVVINAT